MGAVRAQPQVWQVTWRLVGESARRSWLPHAGHVAGCGLCSPVSVRSLLARVRMSWAKVG